MTHDVNTREEIITFFEEVDPNFISVHQKLNKIFHLLAKKGYQPVSVDYDWFTKRDFRLHFYEGVTELSFPSLPKGLIAKNLAEGGFLLKSPLTSTMSIMQIAELVLSWAKSLPKTEICSFEIDLPDSDDRSELVDEVSLETGIYRFDYVDGGDYPDSIIGRAVLCKSKSKDFQQNFSRFAKNHKMMADSFIE